MDRITVVNARQAFLDRVDRLARSSTKVTHSAEVKPSTSITAMFMKIPPELRVRIYEYLLIPNDGLLQRESNPHCCKSNSTTTLNRNKRVKQHKVLPRCHGCITGVHPQILATCRKVLLEASKVLYENTDFVARLMGPCERQTYQNFNVLSSLPAYGHAHMKSLTIVCETFTHERMKQHLWSFWSDLQRHCPELATIRIHVDVTSIHKDCSAFKGLEGIPKLGKVVVQVHHIAERPDSNLVVFQRREIMGVIEEMAMFAGKELRVTEALAE